jgi:5-methylcytosine-specific restriction endonuclease McrA
MRDWYARNKESHNAAGRAWYADNREARGAQIKEYVAANFEKVKARQKRWASENRELVNTWKRLRYAENPEKFRAEFRTWRAANPEKARDAVKAWARENPDRVKAQNAKYRACKLSRTPRWLSPQHKAAIVEIYECARLLELLTDEPYEVDHIVPLQGKLVSGLHVPWNLQILTASENSRKGNKFEVR